jgi:sirohydrochlorin cobaltochelatase
LPETVAQLVENGCEELTVVPVFLGQGGHVLRDLPDLMAQLTLDYPQLRIKVAQAVGENAQVLNAIAQYCVSTIE